MSRLAEVHMEKKKRSAVHVTACTPEKSIYPKHSSIYHFETAKEKKKSTTFDNAFLQVDYRPFFSLNIILNQK